MKSKTVKIILIAVAAVIVIAASVSVGYFMASRSAEPETDGKTASAAATTDTPTAAAGTETTEKAEPTTEPAAYGEPVNDSETAKLLLGKWMDSAKFSGYEFMDGGVMKVTYFNMSALKLDNIVEGTFTGTYLLNGDRLTISYTAYSEAVEKVYRVRIEDNLLYLTDAKGEKAMYMREGAKNEAKAIDERLLGEWKSNLSGFEFKADGTVTITYINLESMGINIPISGTAEGVYTVSGDTLEIKYSIYTGLIQKTYTYSIDGNVLTLIQKGSGEKGTYTKGN